MKRLLVLVFLTTLASQAFAYSPLIQIDPKNPDGPDIGFRIKAKSLESGSFEFTVTITRKARDFRRKVRTSLTSVLITNRREETGAGKDIDHHQKARVITVNFQVTAKQLEDANLAFLFSEPVYAETGGKLRRMPAIDFHYALLRDYLPNDTKAKESDKNPFEPVPQIKPK